MQSLTSHEIDALKKENEKLKMEIDETRQRGMKGNIIVSCPVKMVRLELFTMRLLRVKIKDLRVILKWFSDLFMIKLASESL